ncbi:hypothetical protein EDD37DRAFT_144718 [Exophiala viscosa]|uniref:uncharacterized protein n=1 Tax=Exophiala viscosa TaxID=2486360 RepID=UPI00218EC347|nr:hypothetical protein EDD37DRAFT_144718 [Exophiala viscosa]
MALVQRTYLLLCYVGLSLRRCLWHTSTDMVQVASKSPAYEVFLRRQCHVNPRFKFRVIETSHSGEILLGSVTRRGTWSECDCDWKRAGIITSTPALIQSKSLKPPRYSSRVPGPLASQLRVSKCSSLRQ